MKYLVISLFFLTTLFAHEGKVEHLHFFSFLHTKDFVVFVIFCFFIVALLKYIKKEVN